MPDLATVWIEHQHDKFPYACMKVTVGNRTLLDLDRSVGEILTACLKTDAVIRALPRDAVDRLREDQAALGKALEVLGPAVEGRGYFERLAVIAEAVLDGLPE